MKLHRIIDEIIPVVSSHKRVFPIFLIEQRFVHRVIEFGGRIYALGGIDENDRLFPIDHFSVFDPRKSTWTREEIRGDEIPRRRHFSVGLIGHKLYIFGGRGEGGNLNDLFVVDLTSFVRKRLNPPGKSPSPRTQCLDWVWEKKFYVLGGYNKR